MSQTEVTINYSDIKIRALRSVLKQQDTTLEQEITREIYDLYCKHVPPEVRRFIQQMEYSESGVPLVRANPK